MPAAWDTPRPQAARPRQSSSTQRKGSVNAGQHDGNRWSGGIIARDQEDTRFLPTTKVFKKAGQGPGEAALAVAAGRRGRRDLHVLAENGLEGLVPVHHGAEHQRLAEETLR